MCYSRVTLRWIGTVLAIALVAQAAPAQERRTEFVFLVTADGIRHQELFSGVDPALVTEDAKESSGIEDVEAVRRDYWSEDAVIRRQKLMPFFWKELASEGIVLGNRSRGSRANSKNSHLFSYPGYAEILNGAPLPSIDSNDAVFSPRKTVLEYVREELGLGAKAGGVFRFVACLRLDHAAKRVHHFLKCWIRSGPRGAGHGRDVDLSPPSKANDDALGFDRDTIG